MAMAVGYVLVNVSPGQEYQAFQTIKELENVSDATLLFGDYDIIIKLEAESLGTRKNWLIQLDKFGSYGSKTRWSRSLSD